MVGRQDHDWFASSGRPFQRVSTTDSDLSSEGARSFPREMGDNPRMTTNPPREGATVARITTNSPREGATEADHTTITPRTRSAREKMPLADWSRRITRSRAAAPYKKDGRPCRFSHSLVVDVVGSADFVCRFFFNLCRYLL